METKFQTSFIPKKPIPGTTVGGGLTAIPRHSSRGTGSIFMMIGVIVFILSVAGVGGAYLWKQYLLNRQETYKQDLATRETEFNLSLISHLKVESAKITLAQQLLSHHIAASRLFSIIAQITAQNIRFMTMEVAGPTALGGGLTINMTGYGRDFTTVAFQSDVLNRLQQYGLNNVIKNPIVSNPILNENGSVTFALSASVDPSGLAYWTNSGASAPAQQQTQQAPAQQTSTSTSQ